MANNHHFYLDKEEPNKSCLLALRNIILKYDGDITETKKYGMPCFCYKGKALCYLWVDKKTNEPYILMVDGKLLDHLALQQGNRSRMKILRINSKKDIPLKLVNDILNLAISLHKTG